MNQALVWASPSSMLAAIFMSMRVGAVLTRAAFPAEEVILER